jgi:hypothetical protein
MISITPESGTSWNVGISGEVGIGGAVKPVWPLLRTSSVSRFIFQNMNAAQEKTVKSSTAFDRHPREVIRRI